MNVVGNRQLYEYEVLADEENAIAVTLLRSVAEMGDWGYFPTPKAQQIGTFTLEFEVVPYAAGKTGEAFTEGYAFQQDLTAAQAGLSKAWLRKPGQVKPELVSGEMPLEMSFLRFEGDRSAGSERIRRAHRSFLSCSSDWNSARLLCRNSGS